MEILFMYHIPYLNKFYVLFCSLSSILDIKIIYIILLTYIAVGSLVIIHESKLFKNIKTGAKVIAAGGDKLYFYLLTLI